MVKKNLKKLFIDLEKVLQNIDINLTDRPQNISIEKFLNLVIAYENNLN